MSPTMTVGELARAAGVTPKTIRYYEARGLLPIPARGDNGYRYYNRDALNRLGFIKRAKVLGLSLSEISDLMQVAIHGQCAHTQSELDSILEQEIRDCTRQIDELVQLRATLSAARHRLPVRVDPTESACGCPACATFDPACGCIPVADSVAP